MKIYDVFISYRRSDGLPFAEALNDYLTSKGLRVFLDKNEIIDGQYFTTQIEKNLIIAPNYILIATDDVFKFRDKEDWVRKEIEFAIEEYESDPADRTLTVMVPESVCFPEKDAMPESIRNIADAQRIPLPYGEDFAEAFYKALKSVTNINRRNLWFAAHRWLENSKQPGGRFANLSINESILPNASVQKKEQKYMPINVYRKNNENEIKFPLFEAVGQTQNSFYLIGQGGIGKTTALMNIMNNAYVDKQYSENTQIPIFVELSFAPDTYGMLYEGGKSSYIRRSIFKQVRADRTIKQVTSKEVSDIDEVFASMSYDIAVKPITDILSQKTPAPEYLLLLDGLNEVSSVTIEETGMSVVQMIMREIDLLLTECPNVRIVLTSRSDESDVGGDSISRLYLSGVEEETIKRYLESCDFSKEAINKISEDESLFETLQIPLFLTMYASLSKYDKASTQGEILKLFFNERRKNNSIYTMQQRLAEVEKNVTNAASASQKKRIDADMQNFILDFVLPEIAWHMERNNEFYLRVREIRKIIEPILTETDDISICGEFGREIFTKYRSGASAKVHTYKIAKKILERLGDDITEVTESIINFCVFVIGIMQESNGKYGFVHQHIRDYFAAVKNINTIRLSVYLYEENEKELALECMNKAFKDEPVNYTVRRFMGEYLSEHRNKPYYVNEKWNYGVPPEKCDRSLLKRTLDIYRRYFDGEFGYGVYSIVQILKEIRQDLSGSDFSELDLSLVSFNGTITDNTGIPINLNESLMTNECFFYCGHNGFIHWAGYSPDGKYIISASEDYTAIISDALTGVTVSKLKGHSGGVRSANFSSDGKLVVTSSFDGTVKIWNIKNPREPFVINTIDCHIGCVDYASFGFDTKHILISSLRCPYVFVWNTEDFQNCFVEKKIDFSNPDSPQVFECSAETEFKSSGIICNLNNEDASLYRGAIILLSNDGNNVAIVSGSKISVWNAKEKNTIGFIDGMIASFTPSCCQIATVLGNTIKVWNLNTLNCECELSDRCEEFHSVSFCCDKQHILTVSDTCEVKEWDLSSAEFNNKMIAFPNILHSVDCSSDGKRMLISSGDRTVKIIRTKDLKCVGILKGHSDQIDSAKFSPNEENIITASMDGTAKIWSSKTLRCVKTLTGHSDWVEDAYYSNSGNFIITASRDGSMKIWDAKTYNCKHTINRYGGHYYNPLVLNENYIISLQKDYSLLILDALSLQPAKKLTGHSSSIQYVLQINNGNFLATASEDGIIKIWDVSKWECVKSLVWNGDYVYKVTPDNNCNNYFLIWSRANVQLWNASTFEHCVLSKSPADIKHTCFLSDGKHLLVLYHHNMMELWDLDKLICSKIIDDYSELSALSLPNDHCFLFSTENNRDIVELFNINDFNNIKRFKNSYGLFVREVDLRNLHPKSSFSEEEKEILRQYGAIID